MLTNSQVQLSIKNILIKDKYGKFLLFLIILQINGIPIEMLLKIYSSVINEEKKLH